MSLTRVKGRGGRGSSLVGPQGSGGGGGPTVFSAIIWRPDGVAGGNVVTTWPAVQAAVDAAQGAISIYVDASVAPAVVPPGTWNGYGCADLFPYNGTTGFLLTIGDGATLLDYASVQGLVVVCECVHANAFAFDPFSTFIVRDLATIALQTGALVPAIEITPADENFALVLSLGLLDNSLAPGVPVVTTDATATTTVYASRAGQNFPALFTGNEIGGPVGSTVYWENDDTVPPLTSALFFGTLNAEPASDPANIPYAANPADWVGPPPDDVKDAMDRMAALLKTLNGGPIP